MYEARAEPLTANIQALPTSYEKQSDLPSPGEHRRYRAIPTAGGTGTGFGSQTYDPGTSADHGLSTSLPTSPTTSNEPTSQQQVLLAKQTLVTQELRSEVDTLRRDLDRIREERRLNAVHEESPPEYEGPS